VRVPGPEPHFLINPFGLHYSEVTASNLVKVDLDGRIVGGSAWPVNPAGFTLHSAIHRGVAGAHCVMHTHTTAGCAVAGTRDGLAMDNFYAAQLHGRLAYHDFEGVTVHAEEGPRVVKSIDNKPAVILRNHGLLSWGGSVSQAFVYLWTLQRACEIQVAGAALGPSIAIPEAIRKKASADALQFDPKHGGGRDVFDALVRQVDRVDASYRE
jgi:ribulose-5-phosphate 4-epimerase/fuculose-1-phosphate aldolase